MLRVMAYVCGQTLTLSGSVINSASTDHGKAQCYCTRAGRDRAETYRWGVCTFVGFQLALCYWITAIAPWVLHYVSAWPRPCVRPNNVGKCFVRVLRCRRCKNIYVPAILVRIAIYVHHGICQPQKKGVGFRPFIPFFLVDNENVPPVHVYWTAVRVADRRAITTSHLQSNCKLGRTHSLVDCGLCRPCRHAGFTCW